MIRTWVVTPKNFRAADLHQEERAQVRGPRALPRLGGSDFWALCLHKENMGTHTSLSTLALLIIFADKVRAGSKDKRTVRVPLVAAAGKQRSRFYSMLLLRHILG
jgi:hypothetical protein